MAGLDNRFRIAVDIGGTFTDIALPDRRRSDPSEQGIDHAGRSKPGGDRWREHSCSPNSAIPPEAVAEVLHGTTVGSNTILQRKGARTGLITTHGFRDVLEIGRIRMPDMFDLTWDKPKPLVPRRHRLEVAERIAADGSIVEPLSTRPSVDRSRAARSSPTASRRRHRLHQQLPQSGSRAARRGHPARALSAVCW